MTSPAEAVLLPRVGRWSILLVSLGVTASSFLFINGVAFLMVRRGTSLTDVGWLASMPSWGMVLTLVPWGYVLDRVGERIVLTTNGLCHA